MGSPAMNLTEALVQRHGDGVRLVIEGQPLPAPPDVELAEHIGECVIVGIRPSDLKDAKDDHTAGLPTLDVVIDVVEELGTAANVLFRLVPQESSESPAFPALVTAENFTATVAAQTGLRPGDRTTLAVDDRRLHLFDADSGESLRK
jgi:multiple sugar transport system ATP-binding protein